MNKKILTPLACSLLFVACSQKELTYTVKTNMPDRAQETELLQASIHVMEGRVRAAANQLELEDVEEDVSINRGDGTIVVAIKNGTDELYSMVHERIIEPFSFEFYAQADEEVPLEEAELIVAETQGFNKIALNAQHVHWLSVNEAEGTVSVQFTEEGIALKKKLFNELHGRFVGIFVRGQPVYKFLVEAQDIDSDTFTIKTPNVELAQIFADDINVGLHVLFTPVQ